MAKMFLSNFSIVLTVPSICEPCYRVENCLHDISPWCLHALPVSTTTDELLACILARQCFCVKYSAANRFQRDGSHLGS